MKKICILLIGIFFTFRTCFASFTEGKEYFSIKDERCNLPKIIEFFSFFCSYCYKFEKLYHINETIQKNLPKNMYISTYHVDLLGNQLEKLLTHAWSLAKVLKAEKKMLLPIFEGVQTTHTIKNFNSIKHIFVKILKINETQFINLWNSKLVKKIDQKQRETAQYIKLKHVPTIFINGKYIINNAGITALSIESFINKYCSLINYLMKKNSCVN